MDQTRACSKSCYSFRLYAIAALARTKQKCSLRNEKLKANRASETEEQIKERLRIRGENEKIENHEKLDAGKQLRLAVETEKERRTRLENDAAFLKSWQICSIIQT